jgi:branched-chain amino acid transport system substrate-binding protein
MNRAGRAHGHRSATAGALAITIVMVGLVLTGCAGDAAGDAQILRIGVVAPFSGDYESLGRSVRDSVLLAAEAWNQQGGVLGFEVQVVLEDSACDYQGGREAAEAAIDEGAPFLIGAVCAGASEGVAQVATRSGALQITPGSVNLDLTLDVAGEVRDLVYRIPSVDDDQGAVAARFALEQLGDKTAAVLYAEESAYGSALAQAFVRAFEAGEGDVVKVATYDQNAELFFEALDGVREQSPDVLYLPGYYDVINNLVAQARQFGLLMPILGSDGWHAPGLDLTVTDGAYYTIHYLAEEPRGVLQNWVQLYQTRYLVPPDALATMSYDAANLLFSSIEVAGTTDPVLVAQAMGAMVYEGVLGTIVFDENHNPIRSLIVMRADPEGLVYQGRFEP